VTPKPTRAGASGRTYEFDFAVSDAGHTVLIDAVTPYANSINSKYTAFSDVRSMLENRGLVVFDKPLEVTATERRIIWPRVILEPAFKCRAGVPEGINPHYAHVIGFHPAAELRGRPSATFAGCFDRPLWMGCNP